MSTADFALVGASIRTMDPARPMATAVAAKDGVIIAVGTDEEIRRLCHPQTVVVEGAGMHVTPGWTDSHIHPLMGALRTRGVELRKCRTLDDMREALAKERDRVGDGNWVIGWGSTYDPWITDGLRGELIDEAVKGQPTFINLFDGHTCIANPAALALAGIDGPRTFSEAAEIVCDANGKPTGELLEWGAFNLIERVLPPLTDDDKHEMFVNAMKRFSAYGLTALHAMDGKPEQFDILRKLESRGELSCRVVLPMWLNPAMTRDDWKPLLAGREEHGRRWRCGVAKFFIDGVIDTGTGWLTEPDTKGDGLVPFWPDPAYYHEAVATFAGAGFQCITHATGDMGVRCALDAYKAAPKHAGIHHRIEHIEVLHPTDLPRFAAEGVVASMQPLHLQWFRPSWAERVGPERSKKAFPARSLHDSGAMMALGSDWMVANDDPREGMAWAQLRRHAGQPDFEVIAPEEALTPLQTLEGYTTWAAATVGEGDVSGKIATGYRCDLTGVDRDVVTCGGDALKDLQFLLTVCDGEITHRAAK